MTDMKQELDAELSQLVQQYEQQGMSPASIQDSLEWHVELVRSRRDGNRVPADD
jgi:hypothetical protein